MTAFRDEAAVTDRLRRALLAFQAAQALFLGAHRKAKALASPEEGEQFWARSGSRDHAHRPLVGRSETPHRSRTEWRTGAGRFLQSSTTPGTTDRSSC